MEIKEKNNIDVYVADYDDRYFYLVSSNPFEEYYIHDGYNFILPKVKACLKEFPRQFDEINAYIEKIAGQRVYLSQVHWLYMKNIIKDKLGLDVKIKKRYPGILTVAELITLNQKIDKAALKKLSEKYMEKIYIKSAKNY